LSWTSEGTEVAVGDYERIENDRRRAFKLMRSLYDAEERATNERRYGELNTRRDQYLRELLGQLPFSWHIEHAYTPRETAMYGGADHIVVDEEIRIGRLVRTSGDALSRPRAKFWGLSGVEQGRLPTSLADIKIAERIVASSTKPKKTSAQIAREIAAALARR
jgi:hypothetical protein